MCIFAQSATLITHPRADNSISSRVKRRAHVFIANDENVDPNDLPNAPMVFADPDTKSPAQDKESKLTPSKRVFGTQRVALSPRKANGQDSCSDQISSCKSIQDESRPRD